MDNESRDLINSMMIAWSLTHPKEEWFTVLFHDDGIFWEAYINNIMRCQTVPYDNTMTLRGIHRRFTLCIIATEREEAAQMAAPLTTSKDSRTVVIK